MMLRGTPGYRPLWSTAAGAGVLRTTVTRTYIRQMHQSFNSGLPSFPFKRVQTIDIDPILFSIIW